MNKFKPVFVRGTDINDTWHRLLWELWENGRRYKITSGSFSGSERLAFDFVSGVIEFPHTRPLAPTMPEGSNLPVPTSDDKINDYFANYLMDPTLSAKEHYKYASWIVGNNDVCKTNQLQWVIDHFNGPHGKGNEHCSIVIGDPNVCLNYDEPFMWCSGCDNYYKKGVKNCPECGAVLQYNETRRKTSPCLRLLDFRVIDKFLTTHVVYRSWDCFSGWPENMGGFTLLNEYVASQIGVDPGPLSFSSKSLHAYDYQLDVIKMRLHK